MFDADWTEDRAESPALPLVSARRRTVEIVGSCLSDQGVICRFCERGCPEGALRLIPLVGGYARPQVDPARCTGCGDCVSACPGGTLVLKDIVE